MVRKYNKVGRPPRHIKAQRELAINLSWDVVLKFLEQQKTTLKDKVEIAKAICVKNMPTHIEGHTKDTNVIVIKLSGEKEKVGDNSKPISRTLPIVN